MRPTPVLDRVGTEPCTCAAHRRHLAARRRATSRYRSICKPPRSSTAPPPDMERSTFRRARPPAEPARLDVVELPDLPFEMKAAEELHVVAKAVVHRAHEMRPAFSAALTMASASRLLRAIGRSQRTCFPRGAPPPASAHAGGWACRCRPRRSPCRGGSPRNRFTAADRELLLRHTLEPRLVLVETAATWTSGLSFCHAGRMRDLRDLSATETRREGASPATFSSAMRGRAPGAHRAPGRSRPAAA